MYTVVLTIDIILAVILCGLVMLQRADGGALGGLGGGTGSSFMTGRSVGNALTRMTSIVAALFFAASLFLGVLAKQSTQEQGISLKNITDNAAQTQQQKQD